MSTRCRRAPRNRSKQDRRSLQVRRRRQRRSVARLREPQGALQGASARVIARSYVVQVPSWRPGICSSRRPARPLALRAAVATRSRRQSRPEQQVDASTWVARTQEPWQTAQYKLRDTRCSPLARTRCRRPPARRPRAARPRDSRSDRQVVSRGNTPGSRRSRKAER